MSLVKRIWIENDAAYADVRRARQDEIKTYLEPFSHRLGLRKFCVIQGKRRLDITWPMAVFQAVNEIAAERAIVNDSILFKSNSVRGIVRKLALKKHVELLERYGHKPPKRCPTCDNTMRIRRAKQGPSAGQYFWGCNSFPACRYTDDCTEEENARHLEYRERRKG